MLGSCADDYAPHEQHTSLEATIRPLHDGPGVDFTALHFSPEKDDSFRFLTDIILPHLYSFESSACLYSANLVGWDALGIYSVEEGALLMVFGLLPDSVAETFWFAMSSPSLPVMRALDETSTPVIS